VTRNVTQSSQRCSASSRALLTTSCMQFITWKPGQASTFSYSPRDSRLTRHQLLVAGDKNRKRDVNYSYRQDDRNEIRNAPPGRGDIPIMHGDCDGSYSRLDSSSLCLQIASPYRELAAWHQRLNCADQEAPARHRQPAR
jgi:hypothetical protein